MNLRCDNVGPAVTDSRNFAFLQAIVQDFQPQGLCGELVLSKTPLFKNLRLDFIGSIGDRQTLLSGPLVDDLLLGHQLWENRLRGTVEGFFTTLTTAAGDPGEPPQRPAATQPHV